MFRGWVVAHHSASLRQRVLRMSRKVVVDEKIGPSRDECFKDVSRDRLASTFRERLSARHGRPPGTRDRARDSS
jgi:hypothetical protein